jgi:amylosucrase
MGDTMSLEGSGSQHPRELSLPMPVTEYLATVSAPRAALLMQRLRHQFPVLRDHLQRVHGQQPGFDAFVSALLLQAVQSACARDDALWALDMAREADPAWLHSGLVGYCAYVDKFAGTLQGVSARVPYLQELGVSYLHLLPFLKAGQGPNDGGFAVASFDEVEPALGTMADLRALCATLRDAGISAWAQAALAGDPRYVGYFHWLDSAEAVAERERTLNQVFPGTAPGNFTWIEARQAWAWTTFYPYQWDLNYANPAVFADMAAAMLNLANQGVESFRLDSTGYLWKRAGTDCLNQPEVHHLLQALRCLCAIAAPAVVLKAEAIMPTRELPPYFGLGDVQGPECHVAYHSSLMAAAWLSLSEGNASAVREVLRNTPDLPEGCTWLTYVRCHDDIGWNVLRPELMALGSDPAERLAQASRWYAGQARGSTARGAAFQASDTRAVHGTNGMTVALTGLPENGSRAAQDTASALARMQLLYALSFFVGGLPLIYMGDELGQDNVGEAELLARQGPDGRELHRPLLDEAALAQRHEPSTLAGRCFAMVTGLVRQRRERLTHGRPVALRTLDGGDAAVLVLQRDDAIGVFHFGDQPTHVDLTALKLGVATPVVRLLPHQALWLDRAADTAAAA